MTITSGECLFVILLVAAFIGLWRGWIREVITTAILLGVILFLLLGGDALLYRFFFVNLAAAFRALFEGNSVSVPASTPSTQQPQGDFLFNVSTFVVLTGVGYVVGHKAGKPPTSTSHRLSGIIPGVVNGIAIIFYTVAHIIPQLQFNIESPNSATVSYYVPVVFGLAILSVIGVLIVLSTKKAKK